MLSYKSDKTSRKTNMIKQPSSHSVHSSWKTMFAFLIHPTIYGSQVLSVMLQIPHVVTWYPLRKVEYFEETVAISAGLESLSSSLKVRFLRIFLLLTPSCKQLIIKNVDRAVTLFPLKRLPILLLSSNLRLLARLQTLPLPCRFVDPAGTLKPRRN